ncbi:hypothetical protein B0T24DRAFT_615056 [Lasiosphaeria ovina]|uniref:Secreted protein n=1 Tax=Lasiosphaeria ovina TaxID=92902 RepID=A0AAE0NF49_9PEZI|nr:hypothetical protein B0T24DRAFT_615056 [Lasiosphaeria ovina]
MLPGALHLAACVYLLVVLVHPLPMRVMFHLQPRGCGGALIRDVAERHRLSRVKLRCCRLLGSFTATATLGEPVTLMVVGMDQRYLLEWAVKMPLDSAYTR